MKVEVFCYNCLHSLESMHASRCPECGVSTALSYSVFEYVYSCRLRDEFPSIGYLCARFDLEPDEAKNLIDKYFFADKSKTNNSKQEFNAVISEIRVKKLFDYLNYSIKLNENPSIILAPNGFGKTTIFNFVSFMLNPDFDVFEKYIKAVPFELVEISLKNGCKIQLMRNKSQKDEMHKKTYGNSYVLKTINEKGVERKESFNLDWGFDKNNNFAFRANHPEEFNIFDKYGYSLRNALAKSKIFSKIFFIRTNRVFAEPNSIVNHQTPRRQLRRRDYVEDGNDISIDPILQCKEDLNKLIKDCKDAYQASIEAAKNSFASAFIKTNRKTLPPYEDYIEALDSYQAQIQDLIKLGLLEKEDEKIFDVLRISQYTYKQQKSNGKAAFVNFYIDKYSMTLESFKELRNKMETFRSIINERNEGTDKRVEYTSDGVVYLNREKSIPLECLSSGEKNDFIMFFDLIFRVEPKTTVLIDEPEISLHILWQEKYIDNIIKALEGKDCQVILSTHSPDIISCHDDCIANLEVEKDNY